MVLFVLLVTFLLYLLFSFRRQFVFLWKLNSKCKVALAKIPGPPCLPIIGAVHTFKWNSVDFTYQMEDWGRQYVLGENNYYGLLKLWVGPVPLVFCGMPESIRPILESHTNVSKPNQYDIVSDWIGTGLLTSTNEKWHRRRKMLTPTFHFNILQGYHNVFVHHGEILVDLIAKEQGFFDLFPYLKRCALDIICETAMGTSINSQVGGNNDYVMAVHQLSAIIWNYQRIDNRDDFAMSNWEFSIERHLLKCFFVDIDPEIMKVFAKGASNSNTIPKRGQGEPHSGIQNF